MIELMENIMLVWDDAVWELVWDDAVLVFLFMLLGLILVRKLKSNNKALLNLAEKESRRAERLKEENDDLREWKNVLLVENDEFRGEITDLAGKLDDANKENKFLTKRLIDSDKRTQALITRIANQVNCEVEPRPFYFSKTEWERIKGGQEND